MAERATPRKANGTGNGKSRKAASQRRARAVGKGHNGPPPSNVPDSVYLDWLKQIGPAEKAVEAAAAVLKSRKGKLGNIYKAAKNDGCNTDAIRAARHHDRLDHLQVTQDYTDTGRVLRLMESPLATQFSLFNQPEWPEPVSIALAGFAAGKRGDDINTSPHPPGSENDSLWRENWTKGQGETVESLRE
jgi:hypothetical protein